MTVMLYNTITVCLNIVLLVAFVSIWGTAMKEMNKKFEKLYLKK